SARRVVGFAPLAGSAGPYAALETTDANNGSEMTLLWAQGGSAFTQLAGDQPGPRRGVTATATGESLTPVNFIGWAYQTGTGPSLQYAGAVCSSSSCTAMTLPMQDNSTAPATFPESGSARTSDNASARSFVEAYQYVFADPPDSSSLQT